MWEQQIARDLSIGVKQVVSVLELLKEGSTVPFIARYRRETRRIGAYQRNVE